MSMIVFTVLVALLSRTVVVARYTHSKQITTTDSVGPNSYQVTFETNIIDTSGVPMSPITLQVTRSWAPLGSDRFYALVKDNFYDQAAFFRVVPGFIVQWGIAADASETSKWATPILDDPVIESNLVGYVSFATSGDDSRTSQLFVNYASNAFLDSEGFAPFAKVTSSTGLATAEAVVNPNPGDDDGNDVSQSLYTKGGNSWLLSEYPGVSLITSTSLVVDDDDWSDNDDVDNDDNVEGAGGDDTTTSSGSGSSITSNQADDESSSTTETSSATRQFLMLSDVHLDTLYDGSLSSDCKCEQRYDTNNDDDDADTSGDDIGSSSSSRSSLSSSFSSSSSASSISSPSSTCGGSSRLNGFGQFGCDSSTALLESTLEAAAAAFEASAPAFIVFGGDYMRHGSTSTQETLDGIEIVTGLIRKTFPAPSLSTDIKYNQDDDDDDDDDGGIVLETDLGNSDFFPDYTLNVTDGFTPNPYFSRVARVWDRLGEQLRRSDDDGDAFLFGESAATVNGVGLFDKNATMRRGGFYASKVSTGCSTNTDDAGGQQPQLVLVSLNTVIYSPSHTPKPYKTSDSFDADESAADELDPFGQWAWLEAVLAHCEASDNELKVWVLGHIPPALDAFHFEMLWEQAHADVYTSLLERYASTVRGQFFGHTHSDEWRVVTTSTSTTTSLDDANDDPNGVDSLSSLSSLSWWDSSSAPMLLVGSVSPIYDANPSFRLVDFDCESLRVLDWTVYSATLADGDGGLDQSIDAKLERREEVRKVAVEVEKRATDNELTSSTATSSSAMSSSPSLNWAPLYTASEEYGLAAGQLNNSAFRDLTARLLTDDGLFARFLTNFHSDCTTTTGEAETGARVGDCYGGGGCNSSCRLRHVCVMLHGNRLDTYQRCVACATSVAIDSTATTTASTDVDDDDTKEEGYGYEDDGVSTAFKFALSLAILHPSGCSYLVSSSSESDDAGGVVSDWWWGGEGAAGGSERGVLSFLLFAVVASTSVGFVLAMRAFQKRRERHQFLAASEGKEAGRGGVVLGNGGGYGKDDSSVGRESEPLLGGGAPAWRTENQSSVSIAIRRDSK